jgi:hypothetical protein
MTATTGMAKVVVLSEPWQASCRWEQPWGLMHRQGTGEQTPGMRRRGPAPARNLMEIREQNRYRFMEYARA